MILRPDSTGKYQIIGDVYIHGLMDGEGILGVIPPPWRPLVTRGLEGGWQRVYINTETGARIMEDPRFVTNPMTPCPKDWIGTSDGVKARDDGAYRHVYQNERTGEVLNSDPRLLPEMLLENRVELRTITII